MTYTLENLRVDLSMSGECKVLIHPFRELYCSGLGSYRGYYEQPALRYSTNYGDGLDAHELLAEVVQALNGKTYGGYKGGGYVFHPKSCIWIAAQSEATGIQVTSTKGLWHGCLSLCWESVD